MPGEENVQAKQYSVFAHDHKIIDPQYWTNLVFPRSKLRMAFPFRTWSMDDEVLWPVSTMTNSRDTCGVGVTHIWFTGAMSYIMRMS